MSPKKRKTPYEHPVISHFRKGKPVSNYRRGKGDQEIKQRKSRLVGNPVSSLFAYDVTVDYISSSEKVHVDEAKDYIKAFGQGIESREKTEEPKSVKIRMVKKNV